ncbi:hypothetical protein H0H87_008704 [Tephrocybe sp. NHM501043]|nr:hypothetical protein H0H87_008704 [Tephrocybe sp. NHM501043]
MMLDFYGMRLISLDSGLVDRSLPPRNYESRYKNIIRSSHNNLRISRILKCLSEFGFERLSVGLLLHILWEQSENQELDSPGIRSSMDRWWANCLRDEAKRHRVGDLIQKVRSGKDGYVFTRQMYKDELESGVAGDVAVTSEDTVDEASGAVTTIDAEGSMNNMEKPVDTIQSGDSVER